MTKRFLLTEQFVTLQGVTFVKDDDDADVDTYYTVSGAVDLLNNLHEENEELKQSVNNFKDTIIKVIIAYQRKYDRNIIDLVDEVYDEDITDFIKGVERMTEKRFENRLNKSNVKFNILNPVWDNEKEDALNVFKMVDLLNELNDENEQLKSRVEYLERKIDRERTSYQKQHEKWEEEIQKENEQLKSDLRYWRTLAQSLAKKNNVGDFE